MFKNERATFKKLLVLQPEELQRKFLLTVENGVCQFRESNTKNYITVDIKQNLVTADFGFGRPAGSYNYPELISVGDLFMKAFGIK